MRWSAKIDPPSTLRGVPELDRRLQPVALDLLEGFRALVVNGPRQAGKSTLVRQLQVDRGAVVNMDDGSFRDLAIQDPHGFVAQLPPRAAIDEFQRGGDPLLIALKARLDGDRTPGQFVLAGSTQFLAMRTISETLTGRIGVLELLPLSAGEIRSRREAFIDRLFTGDAIDVSPDPLARPDYAEAVAAGGFPEMVLGPPTHRFRAAWCEGYVRTVTAAANIEQVATIRHPDAVYSLVGQIAARSGGELVPADLARDLLVDEATVRSYATVLSTLFLVRLLPAWTTSRTTRAKKRPVMHLVDTALAAHLVGATGEDLARIDSPWFGALLESFVVGEVAKQVTWAERPIRLGHYRDRDQREIDLVLERGRDVVGIEVKASATPVVAHAKHLAFLRDRLGDRFRSGVVLHTGEQRLVLGDRLVALPVSSLWA